MVCSLKRGANLRQIADELLITFVVLKTEVIQLSTSFILFLVKPPLFVI